MSAKQDKEAGSFNSQIIGFNTSLKQAQIKNDKLQQKLEE
jgi:hypothetical protein